MSTEPVATRPRMEDYGLPDDGPTVKTAWADIEAKLRDSRNYWICTSRPDGRPHAMPVWGTWHDGALYFGTEEKSVKARNLAANPAIVVHLESGDDCVVVEGTATRVALGDKAEVFNAESQRKYGMELGDVGTDALFYEVRPKVAFSWQEVDFPNTATRWVFG